MVLTPFKIRTGFTVRFRSLIEEPVSKCSLGMRQRLGIASAFIHQPEILILDEPVNGLDPIGMKDIRELFRLLATEYDMTILLSSHILSEMEHIADRIGVIVDGRIVCKSNTAQIKSEHNGSHVCKTGDRGVFR